MTTETSPPYDGLVGYDTVTSTVAVAVFDMMVDQYIFHVNPHFH